MALLGLVATCCSLTGAKTIVSIALLLLQTSWLASGMGYLMLFLDRCQTCCDDRFIVNSNFLIRAELSP